MNLVVLSLAHSFFGAWRSSLEKPSWSYSLQHHLEHPNFKANGSSPDGSSYPCLQKWDIDFWSWKHSRSQEMFFTPQQCSCRACTPWRDFWLELGFSSFIQQTDIISFQEEALDVCLKQISTSLHQTILPSPLCLCPSFPFNNNGNNLHDKLNTT